MIREIMEPQNPGLVSYFSLGRVTPEVKCLKIAKYAGKLDMCLILLDSACSKSPEPHF